LNRKPFLIVIAAPSGTGKTTLCRQIIKRDKKIKYSVSCTTRPKRKNERNGRDYFFYDKKEFEKMIKEGKLLEYENVYGYYYGTPKKRVENFLKKGYDVIMDLDIKGALNLKRSIPGTVTIFLLPPSLKELKRRLKRRGDDEKSLEERLKYAKKEIKKAEKFDYIVINDKLEKTVKEILCIIKAERLRKDRFYER